MLFPITLSDLAKYSVTKHRAVSLTLTVSVPTPGTLHSNIKIKFQRFPGVPLIIFSCLITPCTWSIAEWRTEPTILVAISCSVRRTEHSVRCTALITIQGWQGFSSFQWKNSPGKIVFAARNNFCYKLKWNTKWNEIKNKILMQSWILYSYIFFRFSIYFLSSFGYIHSKLCLKQKLPQSESTATSDVAERETGWQWKWHSTASCDMMTSELQ